jgi:hypothetical protein
MDDDWYYTENDSAIGPFDFTPRVKGPVSLNTEKFHLCEFDRAAANAMGEVGSCKRGAADS